MMRTKSMSRVFLRHKTMKIIDMKKPQPGFDTKLRYATSFSWVSLFLGRLLPSRAFLRFTDFAKFTHVNQSNKLSYQHVN